jgi:hypothetical protein
MECRPLWNAVERGFAAKMKRKNVLAKTAKIAKEDKGGNLSAQNPNFRFFLFLPLAVLAILARDFLPLASFPPLRPLAVPLTQV